MKKKRLATWTSWERDEDGSALETLGLVQAAAIRVTVVTSSGLPGDSQIEVLELDGLRWSFELSIVPGPEELH